MLKDIRSGGTIMTTTTTGVQLPGLVSGTWTIDPIHSEVGFTVRHLMSKVRGLFTSFEGELQIADNPAESSARATIDLGSVDTRNPDRDAHLRSSDFFSVEEGGTMTFTTTGVSLDGDQIKAYGDLTIKGVTKPVTLDVEFLGVEVDAYGNTRLGLEASTSISRKDWGVSFNIPLEGDRLMIGDVVNVVIAVEAVRQA
jgi:polyisoprenoid-binding protein YceI